MRVQVGELRMAKIAFQVWSEPGWKGVSDFVESDDFAFVVGVSERDEFCCILTRLGVCYVMGITAFGCRTKRLVSA